MKSIQTFDEAVEPLLIICKVLGMVPFQISNYNYKISWSGAIYTIFLIVAYLGGFGYITYSNITDSNVGKSLLLNTIRTLQNLSGLGIVIIVWITSIMNQKKYIQALNHMNEIDKSFRCLGVWTYYKNIRNLSLKLIAGKCFGMVLFLLLELYSRNWKLRPKQILGSILHTIPLLIYTILSLQVYIYLKMIRERIGILNQHLKELQKYEKASVNILDVKNYKLTSPLGTKLSMLRLICPMHHELCKAINMFNNIYGVCLLITFGESFVSVTTNMYYMVTRLKSFDPNELSNIFAMLAAFLINVVESIWVCWICHTTIEEGENSGILLHKIDYEEVELKNQIEMFSLQIAHENLEFSAAGFFPINFTLLYSIVGGVTTYLVILMQLSGNDAPPESNDD